MKITVEKLDSNLKFMSLFVAFYESFEDYLIEAIKNFLEEVPRINTYADNYDDFCKIQEDDHGRIKEAAKKRLAEVELSGINSIAKIDLEDLRINAYYDYIKVTEDGWTKWLPPKYNAMTQRLLTIDGKEQKKPSIVMNSFMWFVDNQVFSMKDFEVFLEIRNQRNDYAHHMGDLIITDVITDKANNLFDTLVSQYRKVNNYWSCAFELSIGGEDIPTDIKIDFDGVISAKLYNILVALDALMSKNYVHGIHYRQFNGLYELILLPIKEGNPNE